MQAPARDRIDEDGRQSLAFLQGCRQTVNMVLGSSLIPGIRVVKTLG